MRIRQTIRRPVQDDVIQLGSERARSDGATRAGLVLLWFMRLVAALWLAQGLLQWDLILGPDQAPFDALPLPVAAAVLFFAVADPVAAVGLWLASTWGGVVWVFTACIQAAIAVFIPALFAGRFLVLGLDLVLVAVYFLLTWRAAHAADEASG